MCKVPLQLLSFQQGLTGAHGALLDTPRWLEGSSQWSKGNATPILLSWDRNRRLHRGHGKGAKQGRQGQAERGRKQISQGGHGKTTPRMWHTHQAQWSMLLVDGDGKSDRKHARGWRGGRDGDCIHSSQRNTELQYYHREGLYSQYQRPVLRGAVLTVPTENGTVLAVPTEGGCTYSY